MFNFRCKPHVHEINMPKNMFDCPLKFILGFSEIFYIFSIKLKYLYTIMYDCEKSSLTHELSYIVLLNFSHLSLFHVMLLVKNSSKKSLSPFSLFWYPIREWTHKTYNYLVIMCVPTYVGMYGLV